MPNKNPHGNHPDFPHFDSHEAAGAWGCFQCCTKMQGDAARDKGYPVGRGRYGMTCPHCGATSFYDLLSELVAPPSKPL